MLSIVWLGVGRAFFVNANDVHSKKNLRRWVWDDSAYQDTDSWQKRYLGEDCGRDVVQVGDVIGTLYRFCALTSLQNCEIFFWPTEVRTSSRPL